MQALALFSVCAADVFATAVSCVVRDEMFTTYGFSDPDPMPAVAERRYPYFRYDGSTAKSEQRTWRTVVLENENIRVTIMPEIGGKVWGATDKKSGVDFIYHNHVVKFRDVAMRGPWTSGGIEFNFGIMGHAPSCATPVDWFVQTNMDESVSVFVSSAEYVTRSQWQVEIRLAPGAEEFETRTTWFNSSGLPQPYYHWMNAAFSLKGNPRFFFPGSSYIGHEGDVHTWPRDAAGHQLDVYDGNAFGGPKSYHVLPGDAGVYAIWWPENGIGAIHRSVSWEKYGRKIWLWALSREGGIWEDLLTDTDGQYTELQSGRCFNQPRLNTYLTPFKHPTFWPGSTECFKECWGVVRGTNEFAKCTDVPVKRPEVAPADFNWTSAHGQCIRGEQYLRERVDAKAEECFRAALNLDPHLSPALTGLASVELRRGKYAACHELCRRALAIDAYDSNANYFDGFAFFGEGDLVSARDRLGVAAFDPRIRSAAYALIARSYLKEGKMKMADDAAERSLSSNDANFDALLVRLVAARGTPRAEDEAKELLARYPLFHAVRYELEGESFNRYVRNELSHQTFLELGSWYEESGLSADARRFFAMAGAESPIARLRLAHLANDVSQLESIAKLPAAGVFPFRRETLPALRWAAKSHGSWKFKYYLAVLLAAFHLDAEADVLFSSCGDDPDEAVFYMVRADRRSGKDRLSDLLRANSLGDSWRVGRAICRHYSEIGDRQAFLSAAKEYITRYPDKNPIQITYADALLQNGRYDDCLDYMRGITLLPSEHRDSGTDIWQAAERGLDPDREVTWPENLGKGRPYSAVTSDCDNARAYELTRAGRTKGDHEPIVGFERTEDAWRAEVTGGAVAKARRAQDYQLFGDWTLRLVYRAEPMATNPIVKIRAPKPIALPDDFDTCTAWIRGTRFGKGANRDPETPNVKIALDFRMSNGTEVTLPFATMDWKNWFLVNRRFSDEERKMLHGGTFLGFRLTGGTQTSDRMLHFDDICFFRERLDPIRLKPRARRNMKPLPNADQGLNTGVGTLPFPTREETIQPDGALDMPADGEPLPQFTGGALDPSEQGALDVKTMRRGRTLIADLSASAGKVGAIRLGVPSEGRVVKSFVVPYLSWRRAGPGGGVKVDMLEIPGQDRPWFRMAMFDWYRSNAGDVQSRNAGKTSELVLVYPPKTDGARNAVSERVFVTLSPRFEDVLPNIPNPPSPWKHVAGRKVWRTHASFDRDHDRRLWRAMNAAGIREVCVCDHETMWRKGGESFTLKTCADPSKGGDEAQRDFTRFMIDELGYLYGPYNNYTDFAPACPNWTRDWVPRKSDGELMTAWMRCYAMRPAAAPEANERIAPEVQRKFGFNTAYNDVHTANTPWQRTDYDARVPGAGTLSEVFFAWSEVMLKQKEIWNGPVWSEGGSHFMMAGLADGNYAHSAGYKPMTESWLPDFDLRKLHPLECDFGMGCLPMFAPAKTVIEQQHYQPHAPDEAALTNLVDRFICATLAHGHTGYLILDYLWTPSKVFGPAYGRTGAVLDFSPKGMSIAMRSYFMTQQIAARYSQCEVRDIGYFDDAGAIHDTSAALASGIVRNCQLAVTYADGTVVVANGSTNRILETTYAGVPIKLPPCGYKAWTADRSVLVDASCGKDGVRADYCESPCYVYIDGRGRMVERPKAKADGAVAMWPTEAGCEVCAVPGTTWMFKFPARIARAMALDGTELGSVEVVREGDWFTVKPVDGAWVYKVEK